MRKSDGIKAVALFSGGLDSVLATRVILEQGIAVTALHIRTSLSYIDRARMLGAVPLDEPLPVESAKTKTNSKKQQDKTKVDRYNKRLHKTGKISKTRLWKEHESMH